MCSPPQSSNLLQTEVVKAPTHDRLINCRNFIEPNVELAKHSITVAQCDLAMALCSF